MEVERQRNESQKLEEKKGEGNLNIEFWQIYAKSSQVPRIIVIKAATVAENNIGAPRMWNNSSNYCNINGCHSFFLLKAIANRKGKLIAIVLKSDNEQYLQKDQPRKEAMCWYHKCKKKIKSANLTRSKRFRVQYWNSTKIMSHFGCPIIIFAVGSQCISVSKHFKL